LTISIVIKQVTFVTYPYESAVVILLLESQLKEESKHEDRCNCRFNRQHYSHEDDAIGRHLRDRVSYS